MATQVASDFFNTGGGGSTESTFFPSRTFIRPAIPIGADAIYFANAGQVNQPTSILRSYVNTTQVLNWTVSRNDVNGTSDILGLCFDEASQTAYICHTGQTQDNTLRLTSVDLTDGTVTLLGSDTLTNISDNAGNSTVGRFNAATSQIHWVGITTDSNRSVYVIQNLDGTIASQTQIRTSGNAGVTNSWSGIYITPDFQYALCSQGNSYLSTSSQEFLITITNLTTLESTAGVTFKRSINSPELPSILPNYGANVIATLATTADLSDGATWLDADMAQAVEDFANLLGI